MAYDIRVGDKVRLTREGTVHHVEDHRVFRISVWLEDLAFRGVGVE